MLVTSQQSLLYFPLVYFLSCCISNLILLVPTDRKTAQTFYVSNLILLVPTDRKTAQTFYVSNLILLVPTDRKTAQTFYVSNLILLVPTDRKTAQTFYVSINCLSLLLQQLLVKQWLFNQMVLLHSLLFLNMFKTCSPTRFAA